jgi:hypothetical protein
LSRQPRISAGPRAVINQISGLSALQETADVQVADPYFYTPSLAGRLPASAAMRDVRTKRVGEVDYKPGVFDPELGR